MCSVWISTFYIKCVRVFTPVFVPLTVILPPTEHGCPLRSTVLNAWPINEFSDHGQQDNRDSNTGHSCYSQ